MAKSSMRRALLFLFGLVLLGVVSVGVLVAVARKASKVEQGSVLTLKLQGGLKESPSDPLMSLLGGGDQGVALWDTRRALEAAATDPSIAAVFLDIRPMQVQAAKVAELMAQLDRFKASGKPVYALITTDMLDEPTYLTAAGASKIWINPEVMTMVNGFQAEITFWRGTLEKLHIEPEVMMFEEYKSAGEPFANKEMSPYFRESITDVVGDIQKDWVSTVASHREISEDAVTAFMARGLANAPDLKEVGLVDELGYRDQVEDALKAVAGTKELETVSLSKYLQSVDDDDDGDLVAVVFGEGQIVANGSGGPFGDSDTLVGPTVASAIRKAADDEDVKAILFRVDSPGGSAVGSDLVWREIERAQEKGKPVVVSMSGVAGSGGYWISMGADAIVAWPSTITGSIGVVFTKFNLNGFYNWIGANVETLSFGPQSGILSYQHTMTEEQRAIVHDTLDRLYGDFKQHVADGRQIPRETVDGLAKGRIWSGEDALQNGLIDKLGGVDVAIDVLREKAGLAADAKLTLRVYPKAKTPLQQILDGDFAVGARQAPSLQDLEPLARELARPQAQALMPELRVE